jgi:hypothetical protein
MNPGRGQSDQEAFGSTRCRAERAEFYFIFYFEPFCKLAPAVNGWGLFRSAHALIDVVDPDGRVADVAAASDIHQGFTRLPPCQSLLGL